MSENRRVQATRKLLRDALLELLAENAGEKVPVAAVCRRAQVNRSTFYAHYEDAGQLLQEIEEEFLQRLPAALPPEDPDGRLSAALEAFFTYVRENEALFRLLLSRRENVLARRLAGAVRERYAAVSNVPPYALAFCLGGAAGLLQAWMEGGFSPAPAALAETALALVRGATA